MVESNNRPTRNKGFYVKMRLSNSNSNSNNTGSRYGGGRSSSSSSSSSSYSSFEKSFCYRYFKWILWLSVSFYFFSSFLFTRKHPISLSKRTMFPHSRALFESFNSSSLNHIDSGNFRGLKVYVYDLPSKYNEDWLVNPRCRNHLFGSEVAIHKALLSSDVRTMDPFEADLFFVPVYVSCNFSTINGFPAIGHAKGLISSAIQLVSEQLIFWNRSLGYDHVFVASHDYGACFHAMEDKAKDEGIPEFLKKSIVLQTFGVSYDHPCQKVENVVIPPFVSPESVRATLAVSPINGHREIFAFFRGKMEVHPKNVSGRFYSKRVRTVILEKYGRDRRFYLKRHRYSGYQSEIIRSKFCLCPLGWAPWSPRLVESVVLGCIPVIIADGIRLPFSSAVPWPDVSLTVAEKDVAKLGHILEHVASTNISAIQKNLWDLNLRSSLLFNDPMVIGDATWHVLNALSDKLDRSHRRTIEGFLTNEDSTRGF